MVHDKSVAVLSGLFASIALHPGCGLIQPFPRDAEVDATWPATDAETGVRDASLDAGDDPGSAEGGAACARDDQCPIDAYCAASSRACAARCDAQGACVGPTLAADNNRLVTDGAHVCYADHADSAGGSTYVVRVWDGSTADARTIGSGEDARVLLVADGYCYYADPSLQRARLAGGAPELVQELEVAPRRVWLTRERVYWSALRAGQLEVYRLARSAGARAELFGSGDATKLWEAGNDQLVFRRFKPTFSSCAIVTAPLTDLGSETTLPMSFSKNCSGALWASAESLVFTQFEPAHYYPFRVDLAEPGVEHTVRLHSQELLMYQVRGAWVYAQSVVDGSSVVGVPNTVSYQRASLDGGATERLFTPTPGTASYAVAPFEIDDNVHRTFAVLDGRLVYQHAREARLIAVPLTAAE